MRILLEPLDELLHAHPLGHLDAMHLEDVLLARADLDEAVLAVGADVGPLAGVDHAVVLERLPLLEPLLAEVALDGLLAVRLHVQLEAGLVLVPVPAHVADEGAEPAVQEDVLLQVSLVHEALRAQRALEVVLGPVPLLVNAGRGDGGKALPADGAKNFFAAFAMNHSHVLFGR